VVERDRFRLGPVDLELRWRDRLALTGPNGAGKSTLLGLLTGELRPAAGTVRLGSGVVVGHLGQDRTPWPGHPVGGGQGAGPTCRSPTSRSLLAKFDLGAEHLTRPEAALSPGRALPGRPGRAGRLGTNLLLLDEPTNHLDLDAIEELERALPATTAPWWWSATTGGCWPACAWTGAWRWSPAGSPKRPCPSPHPDRLSGMNLYREQGVVLRTWKLGEADRIVVLLTQGEGKVRAVAKGVRKTKSRFGGRLEPFSHVDLSLYRGRELDIVTQAEVITPFRALREDYDRVVAGTAMLEAVDQVAQEREAAIRLYLLLVRALRALDGAPRDPSVVLDAFLLKLMALEGYRPALAECAGCGATVPPRCFSIARGGGLCERCRSGQESTLDAATMPLLAALLGDDLDTTAAGRPGPALPARGRRPGQGLRRVPPGPPPARVPLVAR
jgi:DNA repair protein RecO (recombination protein O)